MIGIYSPGHALHGSFMPMQERDGAFHLAPYTVSLCNSSDSAGQHDLGVPQGLRRKG